jgi:hypothetical protein
MPYGNNAAARRPRIVWGCQIQAAGKPPKPRDVQSSNDPSVAGVAEHACEHGTM